MKERILTNWTLTRVIYLLIGGAIMINALVGKEWFVVLWGAYFASMGLLGFGCASGGCYTFNRPVESTDKSNARGSDPEFEEVK